MYDSRGTYVKSALLCLGLTGELFNIIQFLLQDPFAKKDKVSNSPVAGNSPHEAERPGVGRKKAADLPDAGYVAPTASQKGCCGCVVM